LTFCAIHTSPWARLNELAYQSDGFDFGGLILGEHPHGFMRAHSVVAPSPELRRKLSNFLDMAPGELFMAAAVHDAHPDERPTTSTCRWSATATRTLSSNPKPSPPHPH
jgi:hypothetical protein